MTWGEGICSVASITNLIPTAKEKAQIDALKLPAWVDRKSAIKIQMVDGKREKVLVADLPAFLRRSGPCVQAGGGDFRARWVAKGTRLTVDMEDGGKLFYQVQKAGSLFVRRVWNRRKRKTETAFDGTAVLVFDADLERHMNPANWKAKE